MYCLRIAKAQIVTVKEGDIVKITVVTEHITSKEKNGWTRIPIFNWSKVNIIYLFNKYVNVFVCINAFVYENSLGII